MASRVRYHPSPALLRARRQTHAIAMVILSMRLSVALVIHARMVQYIEICCGSHDRVTFLPFEAKFRNPEFRVLPGTKKLNKGTPDKSEK